MTTIGSQNPDAYQQYDWDREHPRVVHVHIYLDKGVSEKRARELIAQWKDEDAVLYGIDLEPTGFDPMPRGLGLFHNSLLDQVDTIPLRGNDDRIFYFVNQRARDYLYSYIGIFPLGLIPPEVLGEVDDPTMTHGWVWAHAESLPSFILPPDYTTWHELYHLIGSCPHGDDMGAPGGCYDHIHTLKTTPTADEFFASMSADGKHAYHSRAEVNARLAGWRDPLWPFATSQEPKNLSPTPLPPVPAERQLSNQSPHNLEHD